MGTSLKTILKRFKIRSSNKVFNAFFITARNKEATYVPVYLSFHILQEFAVGLSKLLRGTLSDKLLWTFKLYDINQDGFISRNVRFICDWFKLASLLIVSMGKALSGIPHFGVIDKWPATSK